MNRIMDHLLKMDMSDLSLLYGPPRRAGECGNGRIQGHSARYEPSRHTFRQVCVDMHVLLIEDNPSDAALVRVFLRRELSSRCKFEHQLTLKQGLERLRRGGIDVALIDLDLPDSQGPSTVQTVRAEADGVPIVVLTGFDEEEAALEAVRMGAQDYLVKGKTDAALLVRTLQFAIERAAHQAQRREVADEATAIAERIGTLTDREREILDLIVTGQSLKEIAGRFGTSYNTLKNQRASIMEKMQVRSETDLVRVTLMCRFGR